MQQLNLQSGQTSDVLCCTGHGLPVEGPLLIIEARGWCLSFKTGFNYFLHVILQYSLMVKPNIFEFVHRVVKPNIFEPCFVLSPYINNTVENHMSAIFFELVKLGLAYLIIKIMFEMFQIVEDIVLVISKAIRG